MEMKIERATEFCLSEIVANGDCPASIQMNLDNTNHCCSKDKGHSGIHVCECGFSWLEVKEIK